MRVWGRDCRPRLSKVYSVQSWIWLGDKDQECFTHLTRHDHVQLFILITLKAVTN